MKSFSFVLFALITSVPAVSAQDHSTDCSMSQGHSKHQETSKRGDAGMGFAQDKTTHHFLLRKDGGAIQVLANSAGDKTSVEQIQRHVQHIRHAFQSGDFDIPMFVHDQTPPGVPVMVRLKDQIGYRYEESEKGGMVVISSQNAEAVEAVHQFLRFQIKEHQTGDAMEAK